MDWSHNGPRCAASVLLVGFFCVALLSLDEGTEHGDLGISLRACGGDVCVGWVMPAGQAWHDGVRPGMRVVMMNGGDPNASFSVRHLAEAHLLAPDGREILTRVVQGSIAHPGERLSLLAIGTLFALLGALVVVRRPDAVVARYFALFAGCTGIALAAAPAAGGSHATWALVVQWLSLLGVAAFLPAFAAALVGAWPRRGGIVRLHWLVGGLLIAGYAASVLLYPGLYDLVRPGLLLYLLLGILGALSLLAAKAMARSGDAARDARIAWLGIAGGTLPFALLTVLPQAVARREILPASTTAFFWCLIPLTLAYAILRHRTLGIRRLVHRGMVHGLATGLVFLLMLAVVIAAGAFVARLPDPPPPAVVTAVLLALAAVLLLWTRRGVRKLVDRWLRAGDLDSGSVLSGMGRDVLERERAGDLLEAMVRRLAGSMRLEAASLILETGDGRMKVAAESGVRCRETIEYVRPRLATLSFGDEGLAALRWDSDALVVARLETGSDGIGYLALGPKEEGEIFLREERQLIATVAPILALAIRETALLADLRDVSQRLTNAEEAERARLARDLHDGPLQKAILLGAADDVVLRNRDGVARDLASELRELCARLRPAILDDLGLVAAIEWLLEQTAQGFRVSPRLTLRGMTEDDRLEPNAELALFRVTQEAVSNALKHGHAASIHVSLARTIDGVQLSVADDGTGLRSPEGQTRGLGIPGMRERLRQVGGFFALSSDRSGTMVTASIPNSNLRPQ